eukprot:gnl/TRDRNA2_/TRDRNA2_160455_c2_seq1.p2 gnl/TRDRNA2_/TRDRNA2_160455_c2~~gnl/TRDRNA2_/TRDRNA2_160455_c2_seq1.p2  ORF type:complete len:107 (-),score=16.47 gnl/TRDRNA2_/TRDRNA2_160455_c2_seq1:11-331(-)
MSVLTSVSSKKTLKPWKVLVIGYTVDASARDIWAALLATALLDVSRWLSFWDDASDASDEASVSSQESLSALDLGLQQRFRQVKISAKAEFAVSGDQLNRVKKFLT